MTRGAVAVCSAAALVLSTTPAAGHDGGHSDGDGFTGDPGFVDTSDTPDFRGAGSPEPGPVVVGVGVDIDGAPTDRPEETIAAGALHASSGGWYATASGVVVAFGGAEHLGDLDGLELNEPIVAFIDLVDSQVSGIGELVGVLAATADRFALLVGGFDGD